MIQLSFEPALDPYHTMFRSLRILPILGDMEKIDVDHVRIIDFYLAFPFLISSIRLRPEHRRYKALGKRYNSAKPYAQMPEPSSVFRRMAPIQDVAYQSLVVKGYIDSNLYRDGWIAALDKQVPSNLASRINQIDQEQSDLMEFCQVLASEYKLDGVDGLKHRTGLMEHRYDAV